MTLFLCAVSLYYYSTHINNAPGTDMTSTARQHYAQANAATKPRVPHWVKGLIIAACIGLGGAMDAEAMTLGAHVGSWHSESGYNGANPGVMVRTDPMMGEIGVMGAGVTVGAYCNSESRSQRFQSANRCQVSGYAGLHRDWKVTHGLSVGVTGGVLTGYKDRAAMPFVIPSVLIGERVRILYAPAVEPKGVQTVSLVIEF